MNLPPRSPQTDGLSARQRRNAAVHTKVVYLKRRSGWVDWKIVTRLFGDVKATGFAKTRHAAYHEAKAKQKEIEAEEAIKAKQTDNAHKATQVECLPKLARQGEDTGDWSQK